MSAPTACPAMAPQANPAIAPPIVPVIVTGNRLLTTLTKGLPVLPKVRVKANLGPHYYAAGLTLGYCPMPQRVPGRSSPSRHALVRRRPRRCHITPHCGAKARQLRLSSCRPVTQGMTIRTGCEAVPHGARAVRARPPSHGGSDPIRPLSDQVAVISPR